MSHASGINFWNVDYGVTTLAGAQDPLLVLGRLDRPHDVEKLTYSLNGGPETPAAFRGVGAPTAPNRLTHPGDFSIDTIENRDLRWSNDLVVTALDCDGRCRTRRVQLAVADFPRHVDGLHVDVSPTGHPQELCQFVDGRWRLGADERGRPCLRIHPADAGYDRVALFTPPILAPAYTLSVRLRVTQWLAGLHNVGLVFGWRGHPPGDGHTLPRTWTTGLGYYFSHCQGLRLRVGTNVEYDSDGRRTGDRVLAESELSRPRALLARTTRRLTRGAALRQIPTNRDYWFRVRVTPDWHALSVWPDGRPEPAPQVTASTSDAKLDPGAAGVIAHFSAVNVYEFHYEPGSAP